MTSENRFRYPAARRLDLVEKIHGIPVADPYRWLEELDSEEAREWITGQNDLTFNYLKGVSGRSQIYRRMRQLLDYEKYSVPKKRGGRYFFTLNDGLQDQSVLYWMSAFEAEPACLLDPNTLSEDGTVALIDFVPSKDGRHLAYGLSSAGSDWQTWRIRDVDTGDDLADIVEWVKFSTASWRADGLGFYYSRYNSPQHGSTYKEANYYHKLFFHKLGTDQAEDNLVYERPDQKEWGFNGEVSDDGRYLIISVFLGTMIENAIFYKELWNDDGEVKELLSDFDASYHFVGNDGPRFFFQTDLGAPLSKLITIDTQEMGRVAKQDVIPESKDLLQQVIMTGEGFMASYLEDAHSRLALFDKSGSQLDAIELPEIGTVVSFEGHPGDDELFYSFNSVTRPLAVFRQDVTSGFGEVFREPEVGFDPADYQTSQRFFETKDGTSIPMFISHHKDVSPSPETPLYLYGYGGFNISQTPNFSTANLVWMEMGGIFVQVNLRGGGEYGKAWHEAGMKLKKQNVFDDFIGAAEYLIDNGFTSRRKLAIGGRSNGGLLIGACLTQRPDLFGAALMYVGVLDMVRFPQFTIGWAWTSDYGSPEDPQELEALLAYSPYHNLKPGTPYPPTMILTGDHDDRVFPAHSFKFAAALQAAQGGDSPVLIRVDTKAGHGLGKPTSKMIEESSDGWAFLAAALAIELK